ncbi:MAG: PD-(D/E)XK nuclease family protein [Clostridia bacterium]|nr:PD-(D/E)XK nuclease family protein [Clostridia bacterium]
MSKVFVAPVISAALEKFKELVCAHAERDGREGRRLIVFCEDRLSLVAERAVCEAVGGTFAVSVYTLSRFLSGEAGVCDNVLTAQGSAMAIRKLIETNREELQLFKRLSATNAAQEVYDTIALLYSSKISADDLAAVETESRLLKRKLHDLEFLYRAYSEYLKERCAVDRNAYLRRLPDVIRASQKIVGADVAFLGFQAFTSSVADCVRACMQTARDVFGIFVGGSEKKYVNEAWTAFVKIAEEEGRYRRGDADFIQKIPSALPPAAEQFRRYAFEPESFHKSVSLGILRGQLCICEAADEEEECEFIASQVLKCVKEDGVRYREISVMLPDIAGVQPALERAFGEYGIPLYVDRRYPLASHSACSFILDYLTCAIDGCRPESVFAAVGSPLFDIEYEGETTDEQREKKLRLDRDIFVNYMLRACTYRGGVRKPANVDICESEGLDFDAVERVRNAFLKGLKLLPTREADSAVLCEAVRKLLKNFNAEKLLLKMAENAESCKLASVAEMSARCYNEILKVVAEAEKLTAGERVSVKEFAKILKSGFTAAEISLIPPKQDAVFVSDLSTTSNTGSKVLFIGGLTDAVPAASQDTAILTDGELVSLEKLKIAVSPKISQVNRRVREITALNFCAFSQKLYLIYPLRSGGEECGVSEVISYARHLINIEGNPVVPVSAEALSVADENFAYVCSRPAPASKRVTFYLSGDKDYGASKISAVYTHLKERNEWADMDGGAVFKGDGRKELYGGSISPTALENYYSCPYKAFLKNGLKLSERREGAFRPLDSGNFIHAVLQDVAGKLNQINGADECRAAARESALNLLSKVTYAVQDDDKSAAYAAEKLVAEAEEIALGTYEQLVNSDFRVEGVEQRCGVELDGSLKVGGRIDRVDSCGDMVRVIDYKTGSVDDSPAAYYMGLKLQLPLYLSAASKGRRAAGAYYFPASADFSAEGASFTLKGFMDGSEEVIRRSDLNVEEKGRSEYVGAYLNGRKLDKAMSREDFADFISYSQILAEQGARGLTEGAIEPSPVRGACSYCRYRGCCGYDAEARGEREERSSDCKKIAEVAREKRRGEGDKL